jgi:hypothetical protein
LALPWQRLFHPLQGHSARCVPVTDASCDIVTLYTKIEGLESEVTCDTDYS